MPLRRCSREPALRVPKVMNKRPLYFDYAATTPVDERVIQVMVECLGLHANFGNPASSSHAFGQAARQTVEQARRQVAELVGAEPEQIVWTSGATESNNLAIKGVTQARGLAGGHIITSQIEHKATLDTARQMQEAGVAVTYLAPDADGLISAEAVSEALREDTFLVSLMLVNNELGPLNDIPAIGARVREHGALLHVDAAQGVWPQGDRRAVCRAAGAAEGVGADSRRWPRGRLALRYTGNPPDCGHGRGVRLGGAGVQRRAGGDRGLAPAPA